MGASPYDWNIWKVIIIKAERSEMNKAQYYNFSIEDFNNTVSQFLTLNNRNKGPDELSKTKQKERPKTCTLTCQHKESDIGMVRWRKISSMLQS